MKKYIHPKLWREAYQYIDNSECFKVADDCEKRQLAGAVFSLLELLNMGFEPVKEEVPEWIDEVIRYVSERDWIAVSNGWKEYLRKAILEHMPKQEQQKITVSEVLSLMSGCVALPAEMCIKYRLHEFLKSKWLLKE